MAIPTYRTTLTALMIAKVLELAKNESPMSHEAVALIGKFAPLQAKIENAAMQPAYITTPKTTLMESLGGDTSTDTSRYILDGVTYDNKEDYWGACYVMYSEKGAACSLEVIRCAQEHMYLEGLMSPEEIAEFESQN